MYTLTWEPTCCHSVVTAEQQGMCYTPRASGRLKQHQQQQQVATVLIIHPTNRMLVPGAGCCSPHPVLRQEACRLVDQVALLLHVRAHHCSLTDGLQAAALALLGRASSTDQQEQETRGHGERREAR